MKKGLVSAKGYQRLTKGHPWVMAADIEDKKCLPQRPALTFFGEHWFFHSPESQIRLRRFGPAIRNWRAPKGFDTSGDRSPLGTQAPSLSDGRQMREMFHDFLVSHLNATFLKKYHLIFTAPPGHATTSDDLAMRWIFSENDLIPGLTLDFIGSSLVADLTTAPIEHFWLSCLRPAIEESLKSLSQNSAGQSLAGQSLSLPEKIQKTLKDTQIVEMRSNEIRKREGLEVIALESPPPSFNLRFNGLNLTVQPASEQKTGFYLDQKFNHLKARDWALRTQAKTALDLFTYQGGFALLLAQAGLQTLAVDQSAAALEVASRNRDQNQISSDLLQFEKADIFEWLKTHDKKYDVVILDPPSLVKSKDQLEKSVRALVGLHSRALELLNPGGLLVTCTCSQAIDDEVLSSVLRESTHATRRTANILEKAGPSPDHSPLISFKEGDYLRAWFISV